MQMSSWECCFIKKTSVTWGDGKCFLKLNASVVDLRWCVIMISWQLLYRLQRVLHDHRRVYGFDKCLRLIVDKLNVLGQQMGNELNMVDLISKWLNAHDVGCDCQVTVERFREKKTCRFEEKSGVSHPIGEIMSTFSSPPMFSAPWKSWKLADFQETKKREKKNLNKILKCLIINLDTSFRFLGEQKEMRCFLKRSLRMPTKWWWRCLIFRCIRVCWCFLNSLNHYFLRWSRSRRMKNKKISFFRAPLKI